MTLDLTTLAGLSLAIRPVRHSPPRGGRKMEAKTKSTGIIAAAGSGLVAAFAVASCCALPIIFAGAGLGAYWFAPVGKAAMPYDLPLMILAVAGLGLSVFLVLRAPRTCAPGDLCARPVFRRTIVGVAAVGAVLLLLSLILE